jgi:hypothetical protein
VLVLISTFVVPAGSAPRIPVDAPVGSQCEDTVQGIAAPVSHHGRADVLTNAAPPIATQNGLQ